MSGKTVFRNIMGILSPGVNAIITERTSQRYGGLLEKAVHLSLEIMIHILGKDIQLADYWRPLYQVINKIPFSKGTELRHIYFLVLSFSVTFKQNIFTFCNIIDLPKNLSISTHTRYR